MRAARRPFCSRHSPAVLPDRRLGHPYSAGARPPGRPAGRYCMARWVSDNNGQVVVGAASNISRRSTMKQATDRARGLHASCHILLTILYYSAQRARESRGTAWRCRRGRAAGAPPSQPPPAWPCYRSVATPTSDATIYRPNDISSRHWPYRIVSISSRKISKFRYIVIVSISFQYR